jgi:glycosyltransferase 2 family protein
MKKNVTISFIIGIILSAAAFVIAFKNVPAMDLLDYFSSINYFWAVPSILIGFAGFFFRALRWQIILASVRRIGFWRLFHPMMIGFMMNCVLPGRVGEVARPVILKKSDHLPFSTGLATVATERVFDIILLMTIFVTVTASVHIDPDFHMAFGEYQLNKENLTVVAQGMIIACLLLISVIVMFSVGAVRRAINQTILWLPTMFVFIGRNSQIKLQEKLFKPLVKMVDNIAEGFSMVKYPKKIAACFGLSLIVWSSQALSLYIMTLGCPGIALSFLETAAVLVIITFFIALPSVPGFWGLWEAGGIFALALFGVSAKEAAGFTLATHAILMFPVIIIGLLSAMIIGVNISKLSYGKTE